MAGKPRVKRNLGKLYKVVDQAFPVVRNHGKTLDVYKLSSLIGVTHTSVYNSFKRDRLSAELAGKLIRASRGKLDLTALAPFLNLG